MNDKGGIKELKERHKELIKDTDTDDEKKDEAEAAAKKKADKANNQNNGKKGKEGKEKGTKGKQVDEQTNAAEKPPKERPQQHLVTVIEGIDNVQDVRAFVWHIG